MLAVGHAVHEITETRSDGFATWHIRESGKRVLAVPRAHGTRRSAGADRALVRR